MKRIVTEESNGIEVLLGEHVLVFCANYIYSGTLTGISEAFLVLENPSIVYETGSFSEKSYKDSQRLAGKEQYINRNLVESIGAGKC